MSENEQQICIVVVSEAQPLLAIVLTQLLVVPHEHADALARSRAHKPPQLIPQPGVASGNTPKVPVVSKANLCKTGGVFTMQAACTAEQLNKRKAEQCTLLVFLLHPQLQWESTGFQT